MKIFSEYYGLGKVLSDAEIESMDKLREEISNITGQDFESNIGEKIAVVSSATNQELIGEITKIFSNMDTADEKAVDEAMAKYKEIIKPAYIACGRDDKRGALTRVINEDIEYFKKQMSQILMAANYHATDCCV